MESRDPPDAADPPEEPETIEDVVEDDLPDEIEMETEEVSSGVDVLASDMLASDGAKKRRVSDS